MPAAVDDRIKRIYFLVATDPRNRGWSKRKIHEECLARVARSANPPKPPSRAWAYAFLYDLEARVADRAWMDEPWSMGSMADPRFGPSPVRVHELLLMARHARIAEAQFTVRQAQWASRLSDVVGAYSAPGEVARIQGLLMFSQEMAEEERWAELVGGVFDTRQGFDIEATNYWAYFVGPSLGGGEPYDTGFRLAIPDDRRGPMSDQPPRTDTLWPEIRSQGDNPDRVRRGPNVYEPRIERLVMAIDQGGDFGEAPWSDHVTLDQFEMALIGMKRASELTEGWDDLPHQRVAALASELARRVTEPDVKLSLYLVDEVIEEWRSTDGDAGV